MFSGAEWYFKLLTASQSKVYQQERSQLFTRVENGRTRGNSFRLKKGRLRLDVKGKFFAKSVVRCWHRLPREAVDAPSLGGVQGQGGWGPGQTGLVLDIEVGSPACGRAVGA